MSYYLQELEQQVLSSHRMLLQGYQNETFINLPWLNGLCAHYLKFSNTFHKMLLGNELPKNRSDIHNGNVEMIFLCLAQMITCIRNLERTIRTENKLGKKLKEARKHFLDRLCWCMERLGNILKQFMQATFDTVDTLAFDCNFVDMLDLLLNQLTPFTDDHNMQQSKDQMQQEIEKSVILVEEIRVSVDYVLGSTLAFANVALNQDKRALSALCQKVMREYQDFANECKLQQQQGLINYSERKLKATALVRALTQMEDHINETLLRLIFTVFLDYEKFSISRLRQEIRHSIGEDSHLDLLIADFDVNMDRTMQIGLYAIAYAPNNKLKTAVRSCLASFESLDINLIPTLRAPNATLDAGLLEMHYNEEVAEFKYVLQQIIDSHAFAGCYYELLTQCLENVHKSYKKIDLENIQRMGEYVEALFQLPANKKELNDSADLMDNFKKICLILRECRGVLSCTEQIEQQRVIKRFKILQVILRKLLESLGSNIFLPRANEAVSTCDDEEAKSLPAVDVSYQLPSGILTNSSFYKRGLVNSESLLGQHSKLSQDTKQNHLLIQASNNSIEYRRRSVQRKDSLRTGLLKSKKDTELDAYRVRNNFINEILKELNKLSLNLSNETDDETVSVLSKGTAVLDIIETI